MFQRNANQKEDVDQKNMQGVPITEAAIPVPPTFLIPSGALHLSDADIPTSKGWDLPSRISKHCKISDASGNESSKRLDQLRVKIESSESVIYIFAKKGKDDMKKSIEDNSLQKLSVARTYRASLLTRGSVHFKRLRQGSIVMKNLFSGLGQDSNTSTMFSIFDLRGFHVGGNNVAIVAYQDYENKNENREQDMMQYALYQTPDIERFIFSLTPIVIAAYSNCPRWAIPITWSGNLPSLPAISKVQYAQWMGDDGGYSATMYAAAVAFHVKKKIAMIKELSDEKAISKLISDQQPSRSFISKSLTGPHVIDIVKLSKDMAKDYNDTDRSKSTSSSFMYYTLAGLNALSFNLVFRKLKFTFTDLQSSPAIRQALPRALLYNVTLREVDFCSSNLTGFGESIGEAWSMNAQPLVSRVNFCDCQLKDGDMRGLLRGLARIWCGGTALAESICFAKNMDVKTTTWDLFFRTFVDPSLISNFWPQSPPPPPNLSFLQELDLRETNAIGPGLAEFVERLSGLKSLSLSIPNGNDDDSVLAKILDALPIGSLEKFEAYGFDSSSAFFLFKHCNSLKKLFLNGFRGDPGTILCGWPQPVPNLMISFTPEQQQNDSSSSSAWVDPSGNGHTPASLCIYNYGNFGINAINSLSYCANGLKKLVLHNFFYWQILNAAPVLAGCGLETLYISSKPNNESWIAMQQKSFGGPSLLESFWSTLATSKTLRDLQLPNQLIGGSQSNEVAMIGKFLKSNRSVQRIGFDSSLLILSVEDVKVLRSAFFGNKKVIDMEYLSKARERSMSEVTRKTASLLAEVKREKAQIKQIFRSHYSKYNRNWRQKPNQLKLPHVERIRVAKREIGKIQRESNKIGTLLCEIKVCIEKNKRERAIIEEEKSRARLESREGQLQKLAIKKKKFITNLVTKLNKAKLRGRKQKSAKKQIPRSAYYKSKYIWPHSFQSKRNRDVHSYYNYYNDPYNARNHYWWFYDNDEVNLDDDDLNQSFTNDDHVTNAAWDSMLSEVNGISCEESDPWSVVDSLIDQCNSDLSTCISPQYLATLHEEASELGIDVISDLCGVLDDGAAVANKLDEIGQSTDVSGEMLTAIVDASLEEQFDMIALESTLEDIPEYSIDDFIDGEDYFDDVDRVSIADADDAVSMYAGAGPRRDPYDRPSEGGFDAVVAGARRRARNRKNNRVMVSVRKKANRHLTTGYKNLTILPDRKMTDITNRGSIWPDYLKESWTEETNFKQVRAMAQSNLFELPDTREPLCLLSEWSYELKSHSILDIEVVLVSQCTLDRLKNLEAQLACWTGKASIAIYLKPGENRLKADNEILTSIENARNCVSKKQTDTTYKTFDVAVTIVEGFIEDEPYPINYLRNVALLEAKRQHLRAHPTLDNSAVLLVDIDFRPSIDLYETVHSRMAATFIMKQRRVVVCAAFESNDKCVRSIQSLHDLVISRKAEGFHVSRFPQGHGPTKFDMFWEKSLKCSGCNTDEYWENRYEIQYEKLFEPYVVIATADVPLYDERFQGYGMNKVTHLASVAVKDAKFYVLPGVFIIAPAHERSKSWFKRYGKQSDETKFSQLLLKGLYYSFMEDIENGIVDPVVSESTKLKQRLLMEVEDSQRKKEEKEKDELKCRCTESNLTKVQPAEYSICY